MKCPYNRKSEKNILQWQQQFDEETQQVQSLMQTSVYNFEMMDCLKEECGAWHNGRCCYASVNLNNK